MTVTLGVANEDGWPVTVRDVQQNTVHLPILLSVGTTFTFTVAVAAPSGATPGMSSATHITATVTADPQTYVVVEDITRVADNAHYIFLPLVLRLAP